MLSGATPSAFAMVGTAVFRIVVSSDSMKKATATSHGNTRFTDSLGDGAPAGILPALVGVIVWAASHFAGPFPMPHAADSTATTRAVRPDLFDSDRFVGGFVQNRLKS